MTHSGPRASCRSRAPCTSFSQGSLRELRGTNCVSRKALIADTATERGLKVSAEKQRLVSRCHATRGIPRYGVMLRSERQ